MYVHVLSAHLSSATSYLGVQDMRPGEDGRSRASFASLFAVGATPSTPVAGALGLGLVFG